MNALCYDIEIRTCIPDSWNPGASNEINPVTGEPYKFCDGWDDHKGMGIGVLCAWDFLTNRPLVYSQENVADFGRLIEQRQVVTGFNVQKFDNKICAAFGVDIPSWKTFDIYRETIIAAGIDPEGKTPGGRKLNDFARVNLRTQKVEDGRNAPKMFQRGEWAQLTTYCLDDVSIEASLFRRAINGNLIDPFTYEVIELELPEAVKNLTIK